MFHAFLCAMLDTIENIIIHIHAIPFSSTHIYIYILLVLSVLFLFVHVDSKYVPDEWSNKM